MWRVGRVFDVEGEEEGGRERGLGYAIVADCGVEEVGVGVAVESLLEGGLLCGCWGGGFGLFVLGALGDAVGVHDRG